MVAIHVVHFITGTLCRGSPCLCGASRESSRAGCGLLPTPSVDLRIAEVERKISGILTEGDFVRLVPNDPAGPTGSSQTHRAVGCRQSPRLRRPWPCGVHQGAFLSAAGGVIPALLDHARNTSAGRVGDCGNEHGSGDDGREQRRKAVIHRPCFFLRPLLVLERLQAIGQRLAGKQAVVPSHRQPEITRLGDGKLWDISLLHRKTPLAEPA